MKIQSQPPYHLPNITSNIDKTNQKQEKSDQLNRFHNSAFVELKKLNQQIAQLQAFNVSFSKIQKELDELKNLNMQVKQSDARVDLVQQRLQNLQSRLDPLLRDARKQDGLSSLPSVIPLDLKKASNQIKDLKLKIDDALNKASDKIEHFFESMGEFALDVEKLKDPRLKVAHNQKWLNSSLHNLIA
ncbi:coiled-coil domain-containing protein [Helicobacter pametensis]|uniref:coiled-coil domain-containing protein n=1 Tax=Helicobacter pametensis TaxID=95149 RepID=UPI000480B8CF|nr:hypothetical protein [Helicobacter pametensis]